MQNDFPILEFDPDREAIISPNMFAKKIDFSKCAVACFFYDIIDKTVKENELTPIASQKSEMGPLPIYEITINNKRVAFFHPGLGAPFAAAMVEDMIAYGVQFIIACGGAGSLIRDIKCTHIVVPTSAVRDEGTSYHYIPPGREVSPGKKALSTLKNILNSHNYNYLAGKTWTTDAPYRETKDKIKRRALEGCLTVEMEAAAMFAVGQFRNVEIAQILYAGDDVSFDTWDPRGWAERGNIRETLFQIALETCSEYESKAD
jgi:uridine phosphorylase